MTAAARQLGARFLGAGRWEVELATDDPLQVPARVNLMPAVAGVPRATVEAVTPAGAGWRAVVAVADRAAAAAADGAAALEYEVRGIGWPERVRLLHTAPEEPAVRAPGAREPEPRPDLDYTTRDFTALRAQLLAVIARRTGGPAAGDSVVSESTALVELLAYLGDALSYRQDAVATEAYLDTARRRVSVTRHAELLDYEVFQGASARTWLRVTVAGDAPVPLPARTMVLSAVPGLPDRVDPIGAETAIRAGALVFETLEDTILVPEAAPLTLAPHAHPGDRLGPGAVEATVAGRVDGRAAGSLVLIETPLAAHVVRLSAVEPAAGVHGPATLLRWHAADALPDDPALIRSGVVLRPGNLVLAEHGQTGLWTTLPPAPASGSAPWPALPQPGTTFTRGVGRLDARRSAAATRAGTLRRARPAVQLRERDGAGDGVHPWAIVPSLLTSGPLARDAVVEIDDDAVAHLRFGDGVNGMRPAPEQRLEARQRTGGGPAGNVGAGALQHLVSTDERLVGVVQPVPATGGAAPETLDAVRLYAPEAYKINDRAVTAADYRDQTLRVAGVRDAEARIDWSGAWPVATVAVHTGTWPVAAAALARVRAHLAPRMPAGIALDVRAARPIAATIALDVAVDPGWTLAALGAPVDAALREALLRPDRFGFGVALHRSQVVTAVGAVEGVVDVIVRRFAWTAAEADAPQPDALVPPRGAVIRIDDAPLEPDTGSVVYRLVTPAVAAVGA